jgi:hypothetical protein
MSRALVLVGAFALAASFVGCGSTPAAQYITTVASRPGQPWPSTTAACTIAQDPQAGRACGAPIVVTSDAGGASPIAIIEVPSEVEFSWRELPVLGGGGDRARVDIFTPFLASGWASLNEGAFSLSQDVPVRPKRVVATAGTKVNVLGTSGDKVVVRVPTAFKVPDAIEVAVPCQALRNGPSGASGAVSARGAGFVIPRDGASIELRDSPDGPAFLVFEPRPDQVFRSIVQRDKLLHIAGGAGLGARHPDAGTLLVDGWADVRRFYQAREAPRGGSESRCAPPPGAVVGDVRGQLRREAMLFIGAEPPGQHFATIRHATSVVVVEQMGEIVSVRFENDVVRPPPGLRYFARTSEIDLGE